MTDANGHIASPAKGRGRGRGRGAARGGLPKATLKKPIGTGRRGRQKLYGSVLAQASAERQKEVKANYAALMTACISASEDLAQRTIDALKNDPHAHQDVEPQYEQTVAFLDRRLDAAVEEFGWEQKFAASDLAKTKQLNEETSRTHFHSKFDEITDDFLDASLLRLEKLEHMFDAKLPVDLADGGYAYCQITKVQGADLRAHVEYRNGIEVPCAKTLAELEAAEQKAKGPSTPGKRKADGEPEGQPGAKRPANAADDAGASLAPRHIGGLLSASAQEDDGAGSPGRDSKMPSPSPQDEGQSPAANEDEAEDGELASPAVEEKLPPVPNGASNPDALGVRLVTKRKINSEVNNRIMVPALFEFEDWEIGFRDSTNDKTRKATKAKRGKYLSGPGSNSFHFDRSVLGYDATAYGDGELDEELVKRHGLHPKYGVFLKTSVNNEEPPKKFVSGEKPIVFHTPEGKTIQSSRSLQLNRMQRGIERMAVNSGLRNALASFCEDEDIDEASIRPLPQDVERHRDEMLKDYVGTGLQRAGKAVKAEKEAEARAAESLHTLLEAAASVDAQEETRAAALSVTPRRTTVSRSFDPVRDVFVDAESPVVSPRENVRHEDARLENVLSLFADIATAAPSLPASRHGDAAPSYQRPLPPAPAVYAPPPPQPPALQLEQRPVYHESSMQPPPPALAMYPQPPVFQPPPPQPDQPGPYHEPAMQPPPSQRATPLPEAGVIDPRLFEAPPQEPMAPAPPPPAPAPTFLQTALNPPAQYQAPPPAGPSYPGPQLVPAPRYGMSPEAPSRIPFSNPAHGQPEPGYAPHRQMAMSNSGPYYPHSGPSYPPQEQQLPYPQYYPPHLGPAPPPPSHPPHPMTMAPPQYQESAQPPHGMHHHLQAPPPMQQGPFQSGPPPPGPPPPAPTGHHGMPSYHMSPPLAGHAQLRSSPTMDPVHQHYGQQPTQQPLPPLGPGDNPPPRHRSSLSGGGSSSSQAAAAAAAAAAQAAKYRKLEPAPTPPHRRGWADNGSELRTVQYDYREGIKDYKPVEAPPQHGPRKIRGWTYNALKKPRPPKTGPPPDQQPRDRGDFH